MADLAASLNRMSIAHRPPLRWALMLIASMLVVVGCSQFDYQLRIANESDQVWLVRVSVGGSYGEEQFVRRLQPGAEGLALQWNETRTPTLELLREDCSIAGIFEIAADGSASVPAVPGISGTIEPYRWNDRWNVPGIGITVECGGTTTL